MHSLIFPVELAERQEYVTEGFSGKLVHGNCLSSEDAWRGHNVKGKGFTDKNDCLSQNWLDGDGKVRSETMSESGVGCDIKQIKCDISKPKL